MKFFVLLLFVTIFSASATVRSGKCPNEFIGELRSIVDQELNTSFIEIQKIRFINLETIRGNIGESFEAEFLKNSPFLLEEGEKYRIEMKNNKICWIEKI